MNKYQLREVLAYLDMEYAGIVNRLSEDEKKARARHWASEVGALDFDSVMLAVKKLSRGQYMPRTAEVLAEVEKSRKVITSLKPTCRIFRDASGLEILDLRYSDGSEWMSGYLSNFPDWMQEKFRWMSSGDPADYDAFIAENEERDELCRSGIFPEVDALMTMVN